MKKFLVLSILLTASSASFAQADSRCGMPEGHPCSDFFNRFDAFKRLQENENGITDTEGNLTVVETVQKRLNLNLEYTVDNFIFIQQLLGGASATSEARQTFFQIAGEVRPQNQLHDLASHFVTLFKAENTLSEAQGNFSLVLTVVNTNQLTLNAGIELFLSVLRLEGGASFTFEARDTFSMLLFQKDKYPLEKLFNSYQTLLRSENGRTDAVGNFALVISAADRCGSLEQATKDFIEVFYQVGGAGATFEARELFKRLYRI